MLWPIVALLGACAGTPGGPTDAPASGAVRTGAYQRYTRLLLLPPKEDPRRLVPRAVHEFETMGFQVRVVADDQAIDVGEGSGIVVSARGYVVTCAHALGGAGAATITINGTRHPADIIKSDSDDDIALLKLHEPLPTGMGVASFRRTTRGYSAGEDVFTIGYPAHRLAGGDKRMTRGVTVATTGPRDDGRHLRVSAPVEPGDSGSPLLDREGFVIGLIQQTINPWRAPGQPGGAAPGYDIAALKVEPLLDFLKYASVDAYQTLQYDDSAGLEGTGTAVVRIQAALAADEASAGKRMVVRLDYFSTFDLWYRFKFLALAAFDYETEEPLFTAIPGRDLLVGNEDIVIRDTFDQFRKAIGSR